MDHLSSGLGSLVTQSIGNVNKNLSESLGEKVANCGLHGDYTSIGNKYLGSREVWTRCQICSDNLIEAKKKMAEEKAAEDARKRLEALMDRSCIPSRFIDRSFDNYKSSSDEQSHARSVSMEYAHNFRGNFRSGSGLVFSGKPGTGKSHLACSILKSIMPEHSGVYTTCMEVIRSIRATWRKDSEKSEGDVLNVYGSVELLVLDEIGVQYGTDGEQTILFDVLDRRYRDMRPTILLTNQDKAGFKKFIGDRSFDRLVESSRWVSFDWGSYRAQARKDSA